MDWLMMLALIAATVAYGARFVDFNVPPFEDAAMLMRYADHVAHGYGVVWNIGEHPIDGATDFLFMEAIAGFIKAGLPIGRSVRTLGYGSHLLTVALVYWVNRKVWNAGIIPSLLSGLYLAVGTGLSYVAAFFGTPFFALFGLITWTLALILIQATAISSGLALLFAFAALFTGLIRPEGVLLSGLMLSAITLMKGWRASGRIIAIFVAVYVLFGGLYFLWHWNYFGYPLPNPFYKKSGGALHWDSFWESLNNLLRFGGPFILAFLLGFRSAKTARMSAAFLVPLVPFATSFVFISNETNFGGRFQYVLWPLVLISYYPLIHGLGGEIGVSWPRAAPTAVRAVWTLSGLALAYGLIQYATAQNCTLTTAQQNCGIAYEADGRYDVAKLLANYRDNGYVLATSEAGLLPLYSTWRSIDAWGLNDEWIAHHGEVNDEYLDRFRPNLIVFHAYFSPIVPPRVNEKNLAQDWFRMTMTLKAYAETHGYVLAAAFGDSPYESHYYYVRTDFPDSGRIIHEIAGFKNYYWFASGKRAINYALLH